MIEKVGFIGTHHRAGEVECHRVPAWPENVLYSVCCMLRLHLVSSPNKFEWKTNSKLLNMRVLHFYYWSEN
jgi:hypothetical protein